MKRFENKVAIVTGGSRDLGRAVSVQLAADGAKVCVNYFGNEAAAKETAELISQVGGECILVKGDMTKVADVKNLVAETQKAFGEKIDVLVNVVGGMSKCSTTALSTSVFESSSSLESSVLSISG